MAGSAAQGKSRPPAPPPHQPQVVLAASQFNTQDVAQLTKEFQKHKISVENLGLEELLSEDFWRFQNRFEDCHGMVIFWEDYKAILALFKADILPRLRDLVPSYARIFLLAPQPDDEESSEFRSVEMRLRRMEDVIRYEKEEWSSLRSKIVEVVVSGLQKAFAESHAEYEAGRARWSKQQQVPAEAPPAEEAELLESSPEEEPEEAPWRRRLRAGEMLLGEFFAETPLGKGTNEADRRALRLGAGLAKMAEQSWNSFGA